MADTSKLGPWVRRFLLEHLVGVERHARIEQLLRQRKGFLRSPCHSLGLALHTD